MTTKPTGTPTTPTPIPAMKNQTYSYPNRIPYRPNHRHNRRSRRHCSCRKCFCLCCFWSILIIFSILLLAAIAGAIFYFLYHPQLPLFSISTLKISQFNLTTSSDGITKLTTKFNVTLSTTNPNKKLVYTYDQIAIASVSSTNQVALGNGIFPGFISTPSNVTFIHSTVSRVSQILDVDSFSSLNSDLKRKNGLSMKILLDTKVVVQMDKLKSKKVGIRVTCDDIHGQIPKWKVATVASIDRHGKCKVDLRIKILRWTF